MTHRRFAVSGLALALLLQGCGNMNDVQRGTAQGAGIGAGAGAVLGAVTGNGGGRRAAAGAAIGASAGAIIGNIWSARMERQKQEMERAAQGTGVQVTQTADNRLRLDIPTDISFDVNRADIKSNFRPILDKFANTLEENPATSVTIVGHTDSSGSDTINDPLSVNRAAQTRNYLVEHGVASDRFRIDGRGSHEPIASNSTPQGRAENRRVEIYVAEQQASAQPQGGYQPGAYQGQAPSSSGSSGSPGYYGR